jgi:antitoxin ParD1/3/4
MNKDVAFSIGEHFRAFVDEQVANGRYASVSEVVQAGLRLLEEREAHLAALRAALIAGETNKASRPFDFANAAKLTGPMIESRLFRSDYLGLTL